MGEVKTAELRHLGGGRFDAVTGSGFRVEMDDAMGGAAPRPTELLVVSIGGCTAMDVVSILVKKRQQVTDYTIGIRAEQRNAHPHAFVRVEITHRVEGPAVTPEAVRRSIELSATRYCSVSTALAAGVAEIHHRYVVVSPAGAPPVEGLALVTGPGMVLPADVS